MTQCKVDWEGIKSSITDPDPVGQQLYGQAESQITVFDPDSDLTFLTWKSVQPLQILHQNGLISWIDNIHFSFKNL